MLRSQTVHDLGTSKSFNKFIFRVRDQVPPMFKEAERANNPLITVGIVVLNRVWIIGKMLHSLLHQTYPHDRIFVILVDGKSKDGTVEKAKEILAKADFKDYKMISRTCTIPEARNICIENMQGDFLLFWDSDVLMVPNAIFDMVRIMRQDKVDVVSADCMSVLINDIQEVDAKIDKALALHTQTSEKSVIEVPATLMGQTLISRNVLSNVHFDPDLTFREDIDFSVRAREKGFKILLAKNIITFDINMRRKGGSDIYIKMPFRHSLKGLRKKARADVLAHSFTLTFRNSIEFFFKHKRYIFYLGYLPVFALTISGLLIRSYLFLAFPIYLALFALWQIERRGPKAGMQAVLRSIIVGVPVSLWLAYYFTKYTLAKKKSPA